MYELEYLYENLKSQSLEYQYACKLDFLSESSYDVIGLEDTISETTKMISEAADKSKLKLLDKLRVRFAKVDKILSTYKNSALKVNPIGLIYKDYIVFKSDADIKKLHTECIKYLNTFNPDKASEAECKKYIMDSQNNIQYKKMSSIFGSGKERFKMQDIAIVKKSDKELKKSDISDAINYLEKYEEKIKAVQNEFKKNDDEYTNYVRKDNGLATINISNDLNKLRKNALNHKTALINIADTTYYQMIIKKYELEFDQAKKIVVKAANYNPRNLKESYVIQDYIDSMYSFMETSDDIE